MSRLPFFLAIEKIKKSLWSQIIKSFQSNAIPLHPIPQSLNTVFPDHCYTPTVSLTHSHHIHPARSFFTPKVYCTPIFRSSRLAKDGTSAPAVQSATNGAKRDEHRRPYRFFGTILCTLCFVARSEGWCT